MTHVSATFTQNGFRARNDNGSETTATWIAALNTNWSQNVGVTFRFRVEALETAGGSTGQSLPLEYQLNGGGYALVGAATPIQFATSGTVADATATTQQIGSGTFLAGEFDSDGAVASVSFAGNDRSEMEFCLTIDSAQVANNDTIDLRINGLDAYAQTATITVIETVSWTADLTSPSFDFTASPFVVQQNIVYALTSSSFNFSSVPLLFGESVVETLTTPTFNFSAVPLSHETSVVETLTTPTFNFTPVALLYGGSAGETLTTPTFNFTPVALLYGEGVTETLTAPSFNFSTNPLEWYTDYVADLQAASFNFSAIQLNVQQNIEENLTTPSFNFTANPLTYAMAAIVNLLNATFEFNPRAFNTKQNADFHMQKADFLFSGVPIRANGAYNLILGTPSVNFNGVPLTVTVAAGVTWIAQLTTPSFNFTPQGVEMAGLYKIEVTTSNGTYGAGGLVIALGGNEVASVHADGVHSFNVLSGGANTEIEFKCKALNDFIGDVDNTALILLA